MSLEEETIELMSIAKAIGYGKVPPYQSNECYTAGAFDLIIFNGSNRARNFELMQNICGKYREVKGDQKWLKGYFYLLNQLSYSTDTTERPEGLKKILDENPEECDELRTWYRLHS